MHIWNVLHMARWKYRMQKNCHLRTIARLCRAISSQLRRVSTIGNKLLHSNISPTCPCNMVNIDPLMAEICWRVWGTPVIFNGFCVLAALLHGTLIVGVSQPLRHWTEGATYIRRVGHHVGHWPTFLIVECLCHVLYPFCALVCLVYWHMGEKTETASVVCKFIIILIDANYQLSDLKLWLAPPTSM